MAQTDYAAARDEILSEFGESVSKNPGRLRFLMAPIEALSALFLAILVALVLFNVVRRYVFGAPISAADELVSMLFLWVVMLGSVIAIDRNEHLRLMLVVNLLHGRLREFVDALGLVAVGAFLLALLPMAYEHAVLESDIASPSLGISMGYRMAGIPIGIVLMLVMVGARLREIRLSTVLSAAAAVVAIAALLYLGRGFFLDLGKLNILIFLVGAIFACLCCGVPIAFCFGIGTISFLAFSTNLPLSVMVGRMDEGMSSLILLSVPIFIWLGCILDSSGMGKAIVDFLGSMLGHIRAGMSYVMLGSLYLVSGISGSKVSDMATVAPALFPEMRRRGNKPSEMVALLATGAIMADTVPPSIVLIVVGSVAGLSIAGLFASGFIVAFFLLIVLAIAARIKAASENLEGVKRAPWSLAGKTLLIAAPALVLPFIVRGAVTEGIATATEVSAVAVFYALIAGIVLYGGITPRNVYRMLVESAAMTGAILVILGTAAAAAWALTQTGFALQLSEFMRALPGGWITFMIVSVVLFIVLGFLLEGLPAIVLLAPLMFPIAYQLGIDGIHYAMVVVVAMNIGLFTPPIGIGFYIACSIGRVEPDQALKTIWFYLAFLLLGLVFLMFIPGISIGLI